MTVFNCGYRMVARKHGAFELCLPSLGFFFTKLTLRSQYWASMGHMTKVPVGGRHVDLQHYAVPTLWVDLYKIYNQ